MKKFASILMFLFFCNYLSATTLITLPNTYTANTDIIAGEVNENEQHVQSQVNTHNAATTGEHGVTGTFVGTSDTQTLSNKTLTSPSMTSPSITSGSLTLGGSQTIGYDSTNYEADISTTTHITGNLVIPATNKLNLDGSSGGNTYITEEAADQIKFYVGGTSGFRVRADACDITGDIIYGSGKSIYTDGGSSLNSGISGTSRGTGTMTAYIGTYTIDVTAPSDETLKEHVVDTEYGLKDLLKLKVKDFNFTDDEKKEKHTGLIAQQVKGTKENPVLPQFVFMRSDNKLAVNYKDMIPIIIKSVQELNAKIVSQQTQIDSLTKRLAILEKKVGAQ